MTGFTLPSAAICATMRAISATPTRPALLRLMKRMRDILCESLSDRYSGLGRRPLSGADDPPPLRDKTHVCGQIDAGDELVHEVRAFPCRQLERAGRDVFLSVVDHFVGTETPDQIRLGGAGHGRKHAGAESLGQLHRRRTDAAAGALDEDGLAGLQCAARDERVVGGREDQTERGRLDE